MISPRPLAGIILAAVLIASGLLGASPAAAQGAVPQIKDFRSAHFDLVVKVDARGTAVTIPGSGDFEVDPATHQVKMQFQMSAMGEQIEFILLNEQMYLRTRQGQWQTMSLRDAGAMSGGNAAMIGGMSGPQSMMGMGMGSSAEMQRLMTFTQAGQETIDGTPTTRWNFTLNSQAIAQFMTGAPMSGGQSGGMSQEQMAEMMRNARFTGAMNVANDTGFLKRMSMDIQISVPASAAGASGRPMEIHQEFTITFSRFNQPVNIVAPAGAVSMAGPSRQPAQPARPMVQTPRPVLQMPAQMTGQMMNQPAAGQAMGQMMSQPMAGQAQPAGPRPMTQMPRPAMAGPMPTMMPRTGEVPLWPLAGLGVVLVLGGLGARRLARREVVSSQPSAIRGETEDAAAA